MSKPDADVIIVGAGPAGLSAALVLGRACRSVLIFDQDLGRNRFTRKLHGYITREGTPPLEFRRMAREELKQFPHVTHEVAKVESAVRKEAGGFTVTVTDGRVFRSRRLLLATGVVDNVPDIPGLMDLYGQSVFHCPYCDGYELRGKALAVYGRGRRGYGLSLEMTGWSRDILLCSDGPSGLTDEERAKLAANGTTVNETPVARLEGRDGILERVVFADGTSVPRRALFFTQGQTQCSDLARTLGCEFNEKGTVSTGKYEATHIPGLYVAGDASRDVQWVVVAAAEGAEAAYAINQEFIKEELV
jgi:thioredoxin reductase